MGYDPYRKKKIPVSDKVEPIFKAARHYVCILITGLKVMHDHDGWFIF